MFKLENFFQQGLKNTMLFKNNGSISHNGPWNSVEEETVVDRIFLGDFSSAEYTISVDLNTSNKEIIKCMLVASLETASVVVYARVSTSTELVNISARVNDSYVELLISPATPKAVGAKYIYTAQLFQTQNALQL